MTVSTAPSPLSYSGNGSTVAFPITWKYNAKSHIVATLRSSAGTETTWALTTNYTLTDPGDTGTLTAVVAPASGETLVISLEPPNTQSSDIPLGGEFPSVTVEDGLDLAAQRDQKIQSLFDRSLRVPRTDTKTGSALQLPIDTSRAGKYLAFDADGDPIASAAAAGTAVVSTFMETVLDDTTAAAARTTLGLGTAAVVDTGTSGTKVPLLDGNNTHSGTVTVTDGTKFNITGSADATKIVNFEVDGLTTATTRTVTVPDANLTLSKGGATQAQQETGTATDVHITPGVQQYHQSAAKVWGYVTVAAGVPTLEVSYNVTSITDTTIGQLTITIATDFSSINYTVVPSVGIDDATFQRIPNTTSSFSVGSARINCVDTTAYRDPNTWGFAMYGDQ